MRAIALLSGGLDSRLAIKLLQEQGLELEALNFNTIFCTCTSKGKGCSEALSAAKQLQVPLKSYNMTKEIMDVVEKPQFGYGRGLNPCIDCRITMFKKAKEHMLENRAGFIITGEVLGQRPMSQRKDAIKRIEKESGLEGLILRPLSAKLFEPTIPEEKGWVNREKLLSIEGRSRKVQIELAEKSGINDYPCPAGGCLLTEPEFAKKIKDLIKHKQWNLENAMLLKLGRHFRISPTCKLVVGRDEKENKKIEALRKEKDHLIDAQKYSGPLAIIKGKASSEDIDIATRITAYYAKKKGWTNIQPFNSEEASKYRIT